MLEHELVFVSRNFLEVLMQEVFCSFLGISRSIFIENKLLHNFWVKKRCQSIVNPRWVNITIGGRSSKGRVVLKTSKGLACKPRFIIFSITLERYPWRCKLGICKSILVTISYVILCQIAQRALAISSIKGVVCHKAAGKKPL